MNVLMKWLCSSCSGTTAEFRNVTVCFVSHGRRVSSQVAFDWRVSVHTQPNISVCTVTKTFKKTSLRAGGSSKRLFPILRANAQTLNTALTLRSRQAGAAWSGWKGTRRSLVSGCQKLSYIDAHCNCSPTFERNLHKIANELKCKNKNSTNKKRRHGCFP